jgi:hypothetical protein
MNLTNIKKGNIYKNYKSLCEALNEKIEAGNSKKAQIKRWEQYIKFKKEGNKYIIIEIYNSPKSKKDLRTGGNNKVTYINNVEKLILDLLVQDKNHGEVFLSKNKLLQTLQMVNSNYSFGKYKPVKLSKYTNISKDEINEFYEVSDSMLQRNLEAALRNLRNRALIFWENSLTIGYISSYIPTNEENKIKAYKTEMIDEDGDLELNFEVARPVKQITHRKATKEEIELILRTEKKVLKSLTCNSIQDTYKKGIHDQFYKEVTNILFEKANIYLYYNSYEITYNKTDVLEEWNELEQLRLKESEKDKTQKELNKSIVNKLNKNAKNRHKTAEEKFNKTQKDKYKLRMSSQYIINNEILTETLINTETEHI